MRAWILALAALAASGCAGHDALDDAFGPSGETLRERIAAAPLEQREAFAVMEQRCTKCHSLNVPFSARLAAGTWSLQVRKMSRKSGAGIPEKDGERIAAFLEYLEAERARPPKEK